MSLKVNNSYNVSNQYIHKKETEHKEFASYPSRIADTALDFLGPKAPDVKPVKELKCAPEVSLDELDSAVVYDHVVVGGGVAGVFTAEILSRDGSKVALIEKHGKIGEESSGEQHGWGQFGSLYLNAEDQGVAEACLHNVDLLKDDYHSLPGNNLTAAKDNRGELISKDPNNKNNWFRSDPIYYYYPDSSDKKLNLSEKQSKDWDQTLGRIMHRTGLIAEHNWNKEADVKLNTDKELEKKALIAKKTARKWKKMVIENQPKGLIAKKSKSHQIINRDLTNYSIIASHDRPMRSTNILNAVHDQFIKNGGVDIMGTEVAAYEEMDKELVQLTTKDHHTIKARNVVFTAGGGINDLEGAKTNTVLSPLLVVTPAVCDRNFVHMTPLREHTINHIFHEDPTTGKTYSLIGNGDAVKPGDAEGLEKSRVGILTFAEELFPEMQKRSKESKVVYFGHKNEILKEGKDRNYHFELVPLKGKKVWAAVPGKFTLAPSLAHHIYKTVHGKTAPAIPNTAHHSATGRKAEIAPQLHRQIVARSITNPSMRKARNHVEMN